MSGAFSPHCFSHVVKVSISRAWAALIWSASLATFGSRVRPWVMSTISMAWAWWASMLEANATSASLYSAAAELEAEPEPREESPLDWDVESSLPQAAVTAGQR